MQYVKLNKINLKNDPAINEKWFQSIIANNSSILEIRDILLKDMERKQLKAGRLDLLFRDENNRRYCVELQLVKTDESQQMNAIKFENEIDLQFIIVLGETALQNYTENEKNILYFNGQRMFFS